MASQNESYVPLTRVFVQRSPLSRQKSLGWLISRDLEYEDTLTWDRLSNYRFTVVLGEPGSGKSTELRERVNVLTARNEAAFFLRIEDFAENVRVDGQLEQVIKGLKPGEKFHLFMDSVDEARLVDPDAFGKTVKNLSTWLGERIVDARVVISCRIRDWRGEPDIADIEARYLAKIPSSFRQLKADEPTMNMEGNNEAGALSTATRSESSLQDLAVVTLAPLTRALVTELLGGLNCPNTADFVEQLDRRQAWSLAYRPIDAIALLRYWEENERLGSYTELLEYSTDVRLRETNWHHSRYRTITQDKAMEGAERIAAAMVLCRKSTILFSSSDPGEEENSLDPQDVLTEWSFREVQNLLSTALFEGVSQGRVDFHHQNAQEYLAAKWLLNLRAVVGRNAFEHLLFDQVYDRLVTVHQREPLVSWIAPYEPPIERLALAVAPEILMEHGDPGRFDLGDKQDIIDRFVGKFADKGIVDVEFTRASIKRFAEPALSSSIGAHISNACLTDAIRIQLIEISKLGDLDVSESLRGIALSSNESIGLRVKAIVAYSVIAQAESQSALVDEISIAPEIDNSVIAAVVRAFYPEAIGLDTLFDLLRRSQPIPENYIGGVDYVIEKVAEKVVPSKDLGAFVGGLADLIQGRELGFRNGENKGEWLYEALAVGLIRYLSETPDADLDHGVVQTAIALLERDTDLRYSSRVDNDRIRDAVGRHPALSRKLFWEKISAGEMYWGPTAYAYWRLSASDLEWLLDDLESHSKDIATSKSLLNTVWNLPTSSEDLRQLATDIRQRFSGHAEILQYLELLEDGRRKAEVEWKKHEAKQQERESKEHERNAKDIERLRSILAEIRSGEDFSALFFLAHHVKDTSRFSEISHLPLVDVFGAEIADAAKSGWIARWRKYVPPLDCEKAEPNRIENGVIVGLAGISAEVSEGLDFRSLTETEAVTLARYASRELNGFPSWFADLIDAQPAAVGETFVPQINHEFALPEGQEFYPTLLAKISNSSKAVCEAFADLILDLLSEGDPANAKVLHESLAVLVNAGGEFSSRLSSLAGERVKRINGLTPQAVQWLIIWLSSDAASALSYLEERRQIENIDETVEKVAAALGRPFFHYSIPGERDFINMPHLARFAQLVYEHVRFVDDVRRPPGGFTPTDRDDAQSFRAGLLERLANTTGRDAYLALKTLAGNQYFLPVRDWIEHLLEQRASKDAESLSWQVQDLHDFRLGRKTRAGGLRLDHFRLELRDGTEKVLRLHERLTVLVGPDSAGRASVLNHLAIGMSAVVSRLTHHPIESLASPALRAASWKAQGEAVRKIGYQALNGVAWTLVFADRPGDAPTVEGRGEENESVGLALFADAIRTSLRRSTRKNWPVFAYYQTNRVFPLVLDSDFSKNYRLGRTRLAITSLDSNSTLAKTTHLLMSRSDNALVARIRKRIVSSFPTLKSLEPGWDGLGSGYKAALSIAFDIAWRMMLANEHLDDPFNAEGLVLISDADIYISPSIQQGFFGWLLGVFPHVQFVASVNNPVVLQSVPKYGATVIRFPDGMTFQEDFSAWDASSIVERLFSEQVGTRTTIAEDLHEFQKICGDPEQSERAYAIYADLMETGSTEIAADLSLYLALSGSERLRTMILSQSEVT